MSFAVLERSGLHFVSRSGTTAGAPPRLVPCAVTWNDLRLPAGGRASASSRADLRGQAITVAGSVFTSPLFVDAGQSFDAANGTQTTVRATSSPDGLAEVASGRVQIGLSSFFAGEQTPSAGDFAQLVDHQVAVSALTLVVSADVRGAVSDLTTQQVRMIFSGATTNWSEINPRAPDEPITVINRPTFSSRRAAFERFVLGGAIEHGGITVAQDTTQVVLATIAQTRGAIGYANVGAVLGAVNAANVQQETNGAAPLCLDGHAATAPNIDSGVYPFWLFEHAYTNGTATGAVHALLKFVKSDDFQGLDLPRLGYFSVTALSPAARASHQFP